MKWKILFIFLCFLILGCQNQEKINPKCSPSQILIAGDCCLDTNNNSICDDVELIDYKVEIREDKTVGEIKKEIHSTNYINISELEEGINKTFYPLYSHSFNWSNGTNTTGFKATYDVSNVYSGKVAILKIKKEYNYHYTEKNFTDFIQKKYNLKVRDWNINAAKKIGEKKLTIRKWEEAYYDYRHYLKNLTISGKPAFFEVHSLQFGVKDALLLPWLSFKLYVPCTPELVLQVYAEDTWRAYYFPGSLVTTNQESFNRTISGSLINTTIAAERVLKLCEGKFDPIDWKSNEFVFRGRDGFYPTETTIKVGEKIFIHNKNDEGFGLAFTFKRNGTPVNTFNSKQIVYGERGNVTFDEPGNYTFIQQEFNPRARIIVID